MGRLIRVLLVDDHPVVREGMEGALMKIGGFDVVGRAATIAGAREMIAAQANKGASVQVVLCDLFFGRELLGFDLLTDLVSKEGSPPVVLFSQYASDSLYRTAVEAGAAGYLTKDAPLSDVVRALRAAAAGRTSLPLAAMKATRETPRAPDPRERSVIALVARGATTDAIASELGFAPKTIEGRIGLLFRRYNVASRAELVARAISEGWITH